MTRRRRLDNPTNVSQWRRGGGAGGPAAHPVPPPERQSPIAGEPLLIESRDVARLLGIGRTKTFQMMASGELPTIRIGRCVRVPLAGLTEWILERRIAAAADDRRLLASSTTRYRSR